MLLMYRTKQVGVSSDLEGTWSTQPQVPIEVQTTVRIIAKKNKGKVLSNGFWKPKSHKNFAKNMPFFLPRAIT